MTRHKTVTVLLIGFLTAAVAGAAHAAKGGGKGKPDGDDGGDAQAVTPVIIEFRDDLPFDRVGSDIGPYVNDYDEASGTGVRAFIGTKANFGNVMLWLAKAPGRDLWLDFGDCLLNSCNPLLTDGFTSGFNSDSSIKVEVDKVLQDGVYGLAVGQSIDAPMRIGYEDPAIPEAGPGFVHFEGVTGSNPCKGLVADENQYVTVMRTGDSNWTVFASESVQACATLPGRRDLAGVFSMPFSFTVTIPQ